LLYLPGATGAVIAPAYDIISTYAYHKSHGLTRKMAMKIGGQYKPEYLERRHLDRLLGDAGLGAAAARRRLRGHALAAPSAAREVRTQLAADGWDAPIFDVIIDIVDRRSGWLADLAAPADRQRPRPAEPAESTSELPKPADPADSAVRVAPGQRWRDSTTTRGAVPNVITIDRVDSDGTVHGTYRPQGTEAIGAGVWPVREFNDFALLEDPHWPTYIVAAKIQMDDPRATELTRVAGELEGARSHTLTRDGLGGPETSWQIVAPTEADALAIVTRVVGPDVPVRAALRWRDEP
jgi:hypothetical protein